MNRSIHISLSPNASWDDWKLALRLRTGALRNRSAINELEDKLGRIYNSQVKVFNSGRSALWAAFKTIGVGAGDEVIIQGFTCVAVTNAVLWCQAKVRLVDIDPATLNLDVSQIEKAINIKTKAIVVQHTFGRIANIEDIMQIAKRKNIVVIEDMAHIVGQKVHGDLAILSFGRDKAISGVHGGAVVINRKRYEQKLEEVVSCLRVSNKKWVNNNLHQLLVSVPAVYLYNFFNLGKVMIWLAQKLGLVSMAVYKVEKSGGRPDWFPAKLPEQMAVLVILQLDKVDKYNQRRIDLGKYYIHKLGLALPKDIPWIRLPVRVKNKELVLEKARKNGIVLGDWFKGVVTPVEDPQDCGLDFSGCENAVVASQTIINLPTYYYLTIPQADKIIKFIKQWLV